MIDVLIGIISTSITSGTVIALVGMGELLAERTGVFNIGLEGIMAVGASVAIIAVNGFGSDAYTGTLIAASAGLLLGFLFAFATVKIRVNQVLCGLALSFLGLGLAGILGTKFAGQPAGAVLTKIPIPYLSDIPLIGAAVFNHNILVYLTFFILPGIITYLIFRTRHGIHIRAVGENPAAADASGVNVSKFRFIYTCVGATLAAVGGAYLTLSLTPTWTEGVTGGRGWIALALVIFSGWRPFYIILGALFFGAATSLGFVAQIQGWGIPAPFLSMIPYLSTILLMLIPAVFSKEVRRLGAAPNAIGVPYYREEG